MQGLILLEKLPPHIPELTQGEAATSVQRLWMVHELKICICHTHTCTLTVLTLGLPDYLQDSDK